MQMTVAIFLNVDLEFISDMAETEAVMKSYWKYEKEQVTYRLCLIVPDD